MVNRFCICVICNLQLNKVTSKKKKKKKKKMLSFPGCKSVHHRSCVTNTLQRDANVCVTTKNVGKVSSNSGERIRNSEGMKDILSILVC